MLEKDNQMLAQEAWETNKENWLQTVSRSHDVKLEFNYQGSFNKGTGRALMNAAECFSYTLLQYHRDNFLSEEEMLFDLNRLSENSGFSPTMIIHASCRNLWYFTKKRKGGEDRAHYVLKGTAGYSYEGRYLIPFD